MSSPTTSLLMPSWTGNIVAAVVGASPTATTFVIDCDFKKDPDDCGLTQETVIVGPWADKTLAPDAVSTGIWQESVAGDGWLFSVRCEMSRTVPATCTTIRLYEDADYQDEGKPTATIARTATDNDFFDRYGFSTFTWLPVTVTEGYDSLSNAPSSAETTSTIRADGVLRTVLNEMIQTVSSESLLKSSATSASALPTAAESSISSTATTTPIQSNMSTARILSVLAVVGVISLRALS